MKILYEYRDLGEKLRKFVAQEFPQGPISRVDETKLKTSLESCNRISINLYRDKYPRKFKEATIFDWPLETYRQATSNEGIAVINKGVEKKLEKE